MSVIPARARGLVVEDHATMPPVDDRVHGRPLRPRDPDTDRATAVAAPAMARASRRRCEHRVLEIATEDLTLALVSRQSLDDEERMSFFFSARRWRGRARRTSSPRARFPGRQHEADAETAAATVPYIAAAIAEQMRAKPKNVEFGWDDRDAQPGPAALYSA